jgi:hypothetical protein
MSGYQPRPIFPAQHQMNPRLLVLSLTSSPGLQQYIVGLRDCLEYINKANSTCCTAELFYVSDLRSLLSRGRKGDVLIIFAPHPLSPVFAGLARLCGMKVLHWLHEPNPIIFLSSNLQNHSLASAIKIFFLSYVYNPLSLALASSVVISSKYAISSLGGTLVGVYVAWSKKPLLFCPLPYPLSLSKHCHQSKFFSLAVCGSLNTDKGVDLLIELAKGGLGMPISILCTTAAYNSNPFISSLSLCESVQVTCLDRVNDFDIYRHVATATHVFIGYKAVTQSGILPIAHALGTIPVVTRLPSFAFEFWDNPSLISVLPDREDLRAAWMNNLTYDTERSKVSIQYFVEGQVKVLLFLCHVCGISSLLAESIANSYISFLHSAYDPAHEHL